MTYPEGPTALARKALLVQELTSRVENEYRLLLAAQQETQRAATHEEAKPENDKDTRAVEQSYLARGQATRVLQLERDASTLSGLRLRDFPPGAPIALGALFWLEDEDGKESEFLLLPAGAGETLEEARTQVRVITPSSPLGRALLGLRSGDSAEVQSPSGKRTVTVARVS